MTGNLVGVDPQLGGLANNGGTTPTLRPASTSPAIGAGINLQSYAYDQRGPGFPRDADSTGAPGGNVDIGAIQAFVQPPPPPRPAPALQAWGLLALGLLLVIFAGRRYARGN